jgi:hypothetical protein
MTEEVHITHTTHTNAPSMIEEEVHYTLHSLNTPSMIEEEVHYTLHTLHTLTHPR